MNSKDQTRHRKPKSSFIDPEQREKAANTREQNRTRMQDLNVDSPMKAIRQYCLDCTCGSTEAVRNCSIASCYVWLYRFGRNPRASEMIVPVTDDSGNIVGYREYTTYREETGYTGKEE
jgi:hypothetical protein